MMSTPSPMELVFLRHGESEGERARTLDPAAVPKRFWSRSPSTWRLTDDGATQARRAGHWLVTHGEHRFDGYRVSPMLRAVETATLLGLPGSAWRIETALAQRSWGLVTRDTSPAGMMERLAAAKAEAKADPWFWTPPSGESLAAVQARVRALIAGLAFEGGPGRHLFVTHAEVIQAVRGIFEGGEHGWVEVAAVTPSAGHLTLIAYSNRDPVSGAVSDRFSWTRGIDLVKGNVTSWTPINGVVSTGLLMSLVADQARDIH